jgi:hypothetical protein
MPTPSGTTLGLSVAQDLINTTLIAYERADVVWQTIADKPLLKALKSKQKTFPNGQQTISIAIQGTKMSDTPGFLQGFQNDDELVFNQSDNVLRCTVPWKEIHAGLIITFTELKIDGISVDQSKTFSQHSRSELNQLLQLAKNRKDDFNESWAVAKNQMLWQDGSQDGKQVPGIQSIITDNPTSGTTCGLSRTVYPFWRHIAAVGSARIVASKNDQTLSQFIRDLKIQLMMFGGKPDTMLCGSGFLSNIQREVSEKGVYTQTGFVKGVGLTIGTLTVAGIGDIQYDPTMDLIGWSKRLLIFDSRRLKLMPMAGEENRTLMPERPYNYMVWMMSKTWTGGLTCSQLNANAIIETA